MIVNLNTDDKLSNLLEDSNESFYWMGFLLADAYFTTRNGIKISISTKDTLHLEKLGKFINCKTQISTNNVYCFIDKSNKLIINKIRTKFNILNKKTYNPPNIQIFKNFQKKLLLCLICGFIDGDGCILNQFKRKDYTLRIKCHSKWLEILRFFGTNLSKKCKCKINKRGYAELFLNDTSELKKIKQKVLKLNIPILERKWNIINDSFISRYEISKKNQKLAFKMFSLNYKKIEIAKILKISPSAITKIYKKYKKI